MLPKITHRRLAFFLLGLTLLTGFLSFSLLVHKDWLPVWDWRVLQIVQASTPSRLVPALSVITRLGDIEIISLLLLILYLAARRWGGIAGLLLYASALVVELFGKTFIDHPPPPSLVYRHVQPLPLPASAYFPTESSYPSGHTLRIFFFIVVLLGLICPQRLRRRGWLSILILATGLIVAYSRVALGDHWPSDVLGGFLLGSGFGFLSLAIF